MKKFIVPIILLILMISINLILYYLLTERRKPKSPLIVNAPITSEEILDWEKLHSSILLDCKEIPPPKNKQQSIAYFSKLLNTVEGMIYNQDQNPVVASSSSTGYRIIPFIKNKNNTVQTETNPMCLVVWLGDDVNGIVVYETETDEIKHIQINNLAFPHEN